ncbi:hypothetical protein Y5S_02523 [Alcanivorax nanhaiticus]|uniref:Uncharacterized protein n=1 Tax=Alcanivorax nanhaiticus TaxID=1177154 RepID=A0A095SHW0_9GAMM|nr:hypothetical protein [Alcanivorax nanhaiticus]KGD64221.1 hypothetical protein Y5S_02523 [Alcanivorax nanhaiticus]
MVRGKIILFLGLVCGIILPAASAANPDLPHEQQRILEQALGPRPEIRNYSKQDQFVTDLLAWKARRKTLTQKLQQGEDILPPQPRKPNDWHHVTGPEDLDTALRNAKGYQQPNYKETLRYDRTTHLSFPLPPLGKQQLADERLEPVRPPLRHPAAEGVPEPLLDETSQLQREMAAQQADLPPPSLERQRFLGYSEMR